MLKWLVRAANERDGGERSAGVVDDNAKRQRGGCGGRKERDEKLKEWRRQRTKEKMSEEKG